MIKHWRKKNTNSEITFQVCSTVLFIQKCSRAFCPSLSTVFNTASTAPSSSKGSSTLLVITPFSFGVQLFPTFLILTWVMERNIETLFFSVWLCMMSIRAKIGWSKSLHRCILILDLRELYAAVPGLRKSLLGVHAKRFEEQYHHLQRRRSASQSLNQSTNSLDNGMEGMKISASDEDDEGCRFKQHSN